MTTLVSALHLHLAFGDAPLLVDTCFSILEKQKIGLVGRNGCGKSSLLKVLAGLIDLDEGELVQQSSIRVSYIAQEEYFAEKTVHEVLAAGFIKNFAIDPTQKNNKTPAIHQGDVESFHNNAYFDNIHLDNNPLIWQKDAHIKSWCQQIGLSPERNIQGLSGGEKKRLGIAQGLISEPDLILLDEPTNHLDIASILWLEKLLRKSKAAMVIISHDRHFLNQTCAMIMELDRGQTRIFDGNFDQYQLKKQELLVEEEIQQAKFDKLLSQEEIWIRKGVEARRTRAQARIDRLEQMRNTKESQRKQAGMVRFNLAQAQTSGKMVAELENIKLEIAGKQIIDGFNVRIARGDKIGIIGPNGIGKTSLVKAILGLMPSEGFIKLGANLEIAYFDQMREQLDPSKTLADTISPGSEWLIINQQRKHVMAYLADFLFSNKRANSQVSSLSGGERNRLLLARLFAKPSNVLVLDEPSNDLDIPTLELLEDKLCNYPGTVFLISHDRSFMNGVVDYIIAPTAAPAVWHHYIGNYDDWLNQTGQTQNAELLLELSPLYQQNQKNLKNQKDQSKNNFNQSDKSDLGSKSDLLEKNKAKLSFNQQRRLQNMPQLIEELEKKQLIAQQSLEKSYLENPQDAHILAQEVYQLEENLLTLLEEWEKLESLK